MVDHRKSPQLARSNQASASCRCWLTLLLLCVAFYPAHGSTQEPSQNNETVNAPSTATAVVHGVVYNTSTGSPLARALVRIEGDAATGALTDGEGRFEIPDVPVGPLTITLLKPGFIDKASGSRESNNREKSGLTSHSVLVAANMPDLNFYMAPTNVIHGMIELSTGDTAEGIHVTLLKRTIEDGRAVWRQAARTSTNNVGRYRFPSLADGDYTIYATSTTENQATNRVVTNEAKVVRHGFPTQYYPQAQTVADATKIHLAGGNVAEANMVRTQETYYPVSAQVMRPEGQSINGENSAGNEMTVGAVVTDVDGNPIEYDPPRYDRATHTVRTSLPNGSYAIQVTEFALQSSAGSAAGGNRNVSQSADFSNGSVDFSVDGRVVSKLRIPMSTHHGSQIQATISRSTEASETSPQSSQNAPITVNVMLNRTGTNGGNAVSYATGSVPGTLETMFTLPGAYWAHVTTSQQGYCLDSFTAGAANLAREPLIIGPGGTTAPLSLALRDDCARLTLALPAHNAIQGLGEEPSYTVYVVPDSDSASDVVPRVLRPSSGRTITIDNLTPGDYHVYTFASPVVLEYRNPAVLAALPSQPVTLSPAATSNLVIEVPKP
jgi:hypothetical protein